MQVSTIFEFEVSVLISFGLQNAQLHWEVVSCINA